jgi:hypothetical protein
MAAPDSYMLRIDGDQLKWGTGKVCGFTLLLCLVLVPGAFAQCLRWGNGNFIAKQTATQSLTLIKPSDPLVDGMLAEFYPGLSDAPGYQTSLQPFLVMVRNDTAVTAVAYAIAWTEHYADGSLKSVSAVFVNRPFTSGMKFLPPSRMLLISPTFNLTLNQYEQQRRGLALYPAESYPWSPGLTSVDVDVDGVEYSDGTFIGPDKTGVLQCFMMARFAARDEALATLEYIQSSSATPFMIPAQLEQTFDKESQFGQHAYKDTLLAIYVRARWASASDLSRILQHRRLSGLESLLQSYVNHNGGGTSPSMFARAYQNLSDTDPRVFGSGP